MKDRSFAIHLMLEEDGGYSATCPALPGCRSQGDTIDQALSNIRQAIELTIEDMVEHGEPVPDSNGSMMAMVTVAA